MPQPLLWTPVLSSIDLPKTEAAVDTFTAKVTAREELPVHFDVPPNR